jgi:hypothetical protein
MYTIEQIKEAFKKCFHKSGEHWFPGARSGDADEEQEAEDKTAAAWEDFAKCLKGDADAS